MLKIVCSLLILYINKKHANIWMTESQDCFCMVVQAEHNHFFFHCRSHARFLKRISGNINDDYERLMLLLTPYQKQSVK